MLLYTFSVLCYSPLGRLLRLARSWCVCLRCVPVSVDLCLMWLSCHLKLSQFQSPQSPGPSPTSSTRPRKVVARVCIRSCVLHWFIKTLVWLEASTTAAVPPTHTHTEKEARYILFESKSIVQVCLMSGLSLSCLQGCTGATLDPRKT